jgi:uncharacterized membrane protein YuzA (DUF378 family)
MVGKWAHIVAMVLLIVGGLNWSLIGLTSGRWNLFRPLGYYPHMAAHVLVGLAALWVAFRRDTYLPFLGETVMPCSVLQDRVPEHADKEVHVDGLKPGAKVLFWAAEPATEGLARIRTWQQAYLDFANAGVTTVDGDGHAVFHIRKPAGYVVPGGRGLTAHVHWRVCSGTTEDGAAGLLGPVQTLPVGV